MIELQTQAPRALKAPLVGVLRNFESVVSSPRPCSPPIESVRSVCRNLFGAPKPGEIDEMLEQEQARQFENARTRYNIDIKAMEARDRRLQQEDQQEQQEHMQLLLTTNKCNSTLTQVISMPSAFKLKSNNNRNICEPERPVLLTEQRLKPYERQPSIKRSFAIRKAPQNVPRYITSVAKTTTNAKANDIKSSNSSNNSNGSTTKRSCHSDSSQREQHHATDVNSKGQLSTNCTVLPSPSPSPSPPPSAPRAILAKEVTTMTTTKTTATTTGTTITETAIEAATAAAAEAAACSLPPPQT